MLTVKDILDHLSLIEKQKPGLEVFCFIGDSQRSRYELAQIEFDEEQNRVLLVTYGDNIGELGYLIDDEPEAPKISAEPEDLS